jgi:hypothetical protein
LNFDWAVCEKPQILYMRVNPFPLKRWQTLVFKITASKLYAAIAVVTFIVGAVAVFYSINLLLGSLSQTGADNLQSVRASQWSGYMVASDLQNRSSVVSNVSASWTVPKVKLSENNTFSGVWVGIGGYGEETLIQTGTEQECVDGRYSYYAWYEMLPDYLIRIPNFRVQAGDTITASISLINENKNTWSIEITDVTRGEHFKKVVVYNSSMLSAEWIVERPKVNGTISTLADFGNVTFTECKATISGITGTIGNFSHVQLVMYEDKDTALVSVSSLDDGDSGFTVSYLESQSATTPPNDLPIQNFITNLSHVFSVDTKAAFPRNLPKLPGA